ncbi:MAG: gliding motility-associated C-terminal domain-containing protein, partial [Reichenbachiella sp.]|uniref:gliding motility-associated C-terminal domain-containing protein n=1 Tax=Reichenbachiella sp. TaxID=2184521 RepID=UPI003265F17A
ITPSTTGAATDDNRLDDMPAGDYQVTIENDGTECSSSTIAFTIEDQYENPVVLVDSSNPDTNCDVATNIGNGDLTVEIQGNVVGDYTFEWYRGSTIADAIANNQITAVASTNPNQGTAVITGADDETISDLSPDTYLVIVTDNSAPGNTCQSTATFTISNVPESHTINETNVDAAIVHVTDCSASNGSITVSDADITSGDVNDYDWVWYSDGPLTDLGVATTTTTLNSLTPGLYYVEATHQTTGCSTGQIAFEVEDQAESPTLVLTENVTDSSCDPDTNEGNGAIDWTIGNTLGAVVPAGDYDFQWYAGGIAMPGTNEVTGTGITGISGTISAGYTGTITGLDGGVYTLRITDATSPNNTCFIDETITLSETIPTYEVTASTNTANTNCTGGGFNGEFEITTISGGALADFTYTYTNKDDAGYAFNVVGDGHVDQLDPGDYQVYFVNTATQCEGNIVDFIIEDDSTNPTIEFTLDQADQYCTGGNGQLTVAATDATSIANGVTYLWGGGEATATINGLDENTYTVTVTDAVTGCESSDSFVVPFDPVDITIDVNNDVNITAATSCGANVNGEIEITDITPDNVTDYNYILHSGTYVDGGGTPAGTTGLFQNLAPDTYYIEAQSTLSDCTSKVFEIIVEDESTPPVVDLIDFKLQENCILTNPDGYLTVGVSDGAGGYFADANYNFTWSGGTAANNTSTYTDLGEGTYTVIVEDATTLCTTTEEYGMINESNNPLILSITTIGNENCVDPNGALAINVLNSTNATAVFEYYLLDGEVSSPSNPLPSDDQLSGNFVENIENGSYTVMVEDTDGGCISEPNFIEIEDDTNTNLMEMTLIQDHALTKCDFVAVRADGQATVIPGPDAPSKYTIYWHDGASLSDAILDSTLTVHELMAETYAIEMTDRLTGCTITDQITITSDIEIVPQPIVELISDLTNCITPNGEVSASVDSTIVGYAFEWQDGSGTVISSSFGASGLDLGSYSVRATDLVSECVSEAASIDIEDARVDPEFTVSTTESTCSELEIGTDNYAGNGEADLIFTGSFGIENQYWAVDTGTPIDPEDASNIISTNEQMSGLNPGDYRVLVIDDQDCSYEATFEITTDIEIFNGVSDNGDGKNDYFRISCADRFPANSIKIYTRSGTLVYQTSGYEDDLNGNVFTGKRNTGLGGGSDGLPSGTYFYIFDKGEGNDGDVYQGYLELVR